MATAAGTNKYLLPCPCGRQTIVEPRQAGETVYCACGASLVTPTLMAMRDLESVPADATSVLERSTWGLRNGLRLVGVVLLFVGLASGAWLFAIRPIPPADVVNPEEIQRSYQTLTPAQTWQYWQHMKQGLDPRPNQVYAAALQQYHVAMAAAIAITLAGAAFVVATTLNRPKPKTAGRR